MLMRFSIDLTPSYFLNLLRVWEKEPSFFDKIIEMDGKTLCSKEIYNKWSIILCKEDHFVFPIFYKISDNELMLVANEYLKIRKENENEKI